MVTNVYIDSSNLYYACLKGTLNRWLDPGKLCRRLLPEHQVKRIRYFTVRLKHPPGGTSVPAEHEAYIAALGSLRGLTVHLGGVMRKREKGSHVNLASWLLLDAFRDDCELAVVVSGASDLVEPIRIITQELDRPLGLIDTNSIRRGRPWALLRVAKPTFVKALTSADLTASQLPSKLTVGPRKLHKPPGW